MAGSEVDSQETMAILCAANSRRTMGNPRWFSDNSSADVYEVGTDGELVVNNNMGEEGIMEMLKGGAQDPKFRMICIGGVEGDTERLKVTSRLLTEIFNTYRVSPRVTGLISTQHMPGKMVRYDRGTGNPAHFQHWYSVVVRDLSTTDPGGQITPSKSVLGWSRFISWTGHDLLTNTTTMILFNCPTFTKQEFTSAFSSRAQPLLAHPHLANTFLLESLVLHVREFFQTLTNPIYTHEFSIGNSHTAKAYTDRSRAFLKITRQVTQVITDYTILSWAITHLQNQHEWLLANYPFSPNLEEHEFPQATWDFFQGELALLKTYSGLFHDRAKISTNECFAMVSQRDSETNLQMAEESTQIARAAHKDSRSLRSIQILTMVFLPASVCSGVFGMGFFSTSAIDEQGNNGGGGVRFSVSEEWWWYLALAVPLTVFVGVVLGGWSWKTWILRWRRQGCCGWREAKDLEKTG